MADPPGGRKRPWETALGAVATVKVEKREEKGAGLADLELAVADVLRGMRGGVWRDACGGSGGEGSGNHSGSMSPGAWDHRLNNGLARPARPHKAPGRLADSVLERELPPLAPAARPPAAGKKGGKASAGMAAGGAPKAQRTSYAGQQTRTYVWRGPCRKHVTHPDDVARLLHGSSGGSGAAAATSPNAAAAASSGGEAGAGPNSAALNNRRPHGDASSAGASCDEGDSVRAPGGPAAGAGPSQQQQQAAAAAPAAAPAAPQPSPALPRTASIAALSATVHALPSAAVAVDAFAAALEGAGIAAGAPGAPRSGRGTHREQDKEWAALTTWLRMNLHQPRTAKRCVLFLGARSPDGWRFMLNPALGWDEVSVETKLRLKTLPQETCAAYRHKYPASGPSAWEGRTQKYQPPAATTAVDVRLADLVYSLQGIYFQYEGGDARRFNAAQAASQ